MRPDAERDANQRMPVPAAGFEQQHAHRRIRAQAAGEHAAGGAGADDDVIEFRRAGHGAKLSTASIRNGGTMMSDELKSCRKPSCLQEFSDAAAGGEQPRQDISSSNAAAVTAIDKLSLSIDEHEFVSIVGPSGCGKSTFLHIVGGFEPATGGELRLNGRPIGPPGPDRGMMFQDLSLFPWLTAIENVAWPLEMKGMAKAERLAKAREYLDLVHLVPLRRSLSRPTERRHEAARRAGAAVRARSRSHADGRAVRRARFADPRAAAGRAAVDLAARPQDRAVRHP